MCERSLETRKQVEVFAKPKGYGKTFVASRFNATFLDLPKFVKIRKFNKWRDWVLMALRNCCEVRGYEVGVGVTDEEISTFI